MMDLDSIKKRALSYFPDKFSASFDKSIMHPEREWFVGFFTGCLLLGVGIYWSVSTYKQFSNISVSEGEGERKEELVYKKDLVTVALADFDARRTVYLELKKNLQETGALIITKPPVETIPVSTSTEAVIEVPKEDDPKPEPVLEDEPVEEGAPEIVI
jgi:hypothetical protein